MDKLWPGVEFPHPSGRLPLLGDLPRIKQGRPLQSCIEATRELGPISEVRILRQKMVFATGTDLIIELCDDRRFEKGLSRAVEGLRSFAGDGLFTAYNDEPNWQLAHDLLLPAFSKAAMRGYHEAMLGVIRELTAAWDTAREPVDVAPTLTKVTMETIGRTAFSRDFGSFTTDQVHPFVTAMVAALSYGQRSVALGAMPFGGFLEELDRKRSAHHLTYIETMLDEMIAQRRSEQDPGQRDLLDLMLHAEHPETGRKLDDVNIRYQILTFMVAGHETTAGALSFAFYYLSRHPGALAAARAEVDALLGDDPDTEPTFEQVPKFRYVRRVLDEALRLWPTVPGFTRRPRADTVIGGRWPMRTDDWAIVLLSAMHRDPEVWGDDAEEFDPDRFLPERVRSRRPHAYLPFGVGARACIGRQFAIHEAVLVLARVLHRYDLHGDSDYRLRVGERLTLMPEGFELTVRRRTPTPEPANRSEAVGSAATTTPAGRCPYRVDTGNVTMRAPDE